MARHKPRPFVDTNVLYSGLYSSRGAPAELLKRHADGKLTIVISRQVLEELVRTVPPTWLPDHRKRFAIRLLDQRLRWLKRQL